MIKNLNRFQLLNTLPFNHKYAFSSNSIQTTTYPYVFGGLKNINFVQSELKLIALKQLFDESTLQGFKQAYKFTLYSLAQKDKSSLQNICQPNLLKNIAFKNVQLVNPDSNIDVVCGSSFKAFGATFIRQSTTELKLMKGDQHAKLYANFGLMNPTNAAAMMKYVQGGMPILMGYEVFFRSSMKLVPQGSTQNINATEIHSLQFQVQGKMNLMKYTKMAMEMSSGKSNVDYNQAKSIIKDTIGDNFEWKVGDIDQVLKSNLRVIS